MKTNMKVAITCDFLLNRSHYTEIIEHLCEVFPEAVIYCFAHRKGAILGHIEQRRIQSTYLSHIVSTEEEFYQHSAKLPSLAKNLFVSCEYDLIINVSKGFSQGFKKCKTTRLVTYLYDLDLENKIRKTFLQKVFYAFTQSWIKKTLGAAQQILVSREDLLNQLRAWDISAKMEVVFPPFRISDYALFPNEMFKHHFVLLEAKGISVGNARNLIEWMEEWGISFQFIGLDEHLKELKGQYRANTFFGNRCSGEHAPVMAACKAFVSFNQEDFPAIALGVLATGRPVILVESLKKWIGEGTGVYFIKNENVGENGKNDFKRALDNIASDELLEGQKLRAQAMKYHDIKFKAQIKRLVDEAL